MCVGTENSFCFFLTNKVVFIKSIYAGLATLSPHLGHTDPEAYFLTFGFWNVSVETNRWSNLSGVFTEENQTVQLHSQLIYSVTLLEKASA